MIVPPSLLQTWETELKKHTCPNGLRWVQHYGNSKLQPDVDPIYQGYDVVLTTLMTVLNEYRSRERLSSVLFDFSWHRVVIDEAHSIRNPKALCSKAACTIEAHRRWAVTGTPIQNRLADFASLLRFLRMYPYADAEAFERDIVSCWALDDGNESAERLKRLAQAMMLRRSKEMIELPPRTNVVIPLSFTPREASEYQRISAAVVNSLDKILDEDKLPARSYANALTRINLLRRYCNLGMLACPELQASQRSPYDNSGFKWTEMVAQQTFDDLAGFGPLCCGRCGLEDRPEADLPNEACRGKAQLTQCLRFLCRTCSTHSVAASACEHSPPCPVARIALEGTFSERQSPETEMAQSMGETTTKIGALTSEIKQVKREKR